MIEYLFLILMQLLWREFFYLSSYTTPNFDRMEVNSVSDVIMFLLF